MDFKPFKISVYEFTRVEAQLLPNNHVREKLNFDLSKSFGILFTISNTIMKLIKV